jgi:hypothetical protein
VAPIGEHLTDPRQADIEALRVDIDGEGPEGNLHNLYPVLK